MNKSELLRLIKKGESDTVEFKEDFDKEAIETAGAFANTKGGIVLVGVSDIGKIKDIQIGKETLKNWTNQISQSSDPRIIPEIETLELNDKIIISVFIKEFPFKPVSIKGRFYKRVGNSNRQMTAREVAELHFFSTGTSFDILPLANTSIDDIDIAKVGKYIKKSNALGRRKISEEESPLKVLKKLELVKEKKPTLAAVVLFGKVPQEKLLQAQVHCGRFKREAVIIDDKLIGGTAIEQVDEVMDFIRKNTNVRFVITGKPQREEIWDYPLEALREAVINAICHRNYSDNSDIQIKIHDDRFTIWNPGGLPFGMTIKELLNPEHSSKPRNKLIAQIFYDLGLIEKYGSGIQRIINACKDADIPAPVFEDKFDGFLVIFRKDIYTEDYLKKFGLNERQIKAVMYVKEKERITNREYQKTIIASERTATRDLSNLVSNGVFEQVGTTGRGTAYVLRRHIDAKDATNTPHRMKDR